MLLASFFAGFLDAAYARAYLIKKGGSDVCPQIHP